ncbi:dihydrofolate reductase [Nocardioides sp. HDW12B]|uniref:dihydrofolate reductase family protein n=1 Tax=Nocardioides sp. HDW12B TaxID=2714939 RepID=UPI00140CA26A|nr:dihydrofolate reductase family protein [Nocardioides sp. HDW12B]QIK65906.1 dihydrofolate reductase [Nocardioides sp. HDW12B]
MGPGPRTSRTVYYTATTLDGFLADEQDSLDWLLSQDIDHDGPMGYASFIDDVGALVMGATTYAWVLDHQQRTGESWSYTQPCWVLTHRDLPRATEDVRLVSADTAEELRAVHAEARAVAEAAGGKDVWLVGGGGIAAALADLGLLDALMVSVAPVTLGAGKRLLEGRTDLTLTRVERNRAFACLWYDVQRPG